MVDLAVKNGEVSQDELEAMDTRYNIESGDLNDVAKYNGQLLMKRSAERILNNGFRIKAAHQLD